MVDFDSNVNLVYAVFNKSFYMYRDYEEDLIQEGLMGLWKACRTFDASLGFEFSTYAVKVIRNEMGMFIRKIRRELYEFSLDREMDFEDETRTFLSLIEDKMPEKLSDEEKAIIALFIRMGEDSGCGEIVRLKLKGVKQVDIAKELGVHQATVSERLRVLYNKVRVELGIPEK